MPLIIGTEKLYTLSEMVRAVRALPYHANDGSWFELKGAITALSLAWGETEDFVEGALGRTLANTDRKKG